MLTGLEPHITPEPPRVARQLKERIAELLTRYSLEEVMAEIAKQKPAFDFHVRINENGNKRKKV